MKQPRLLLGVILGASLMMTACGNDATDGPGPTQPSFDGLTFLGDTVTVDDEPYPLVPGTTLRLSFEDGTIGASAGCNSMSGGATWSDGTLVIDGKTLATTEMGCDPALMAQDTWYASILTSRPTLAQDGDTLTITSAKTVVTMSDEETSVPDAPLTGAKWELDSISTGDSVSSVPQGASAHIQFLADGSLRADLGCNLGHSSYTVSGGQLILGPLASTQEACEPPASDVESAMVSVLHGTLMFSIDGSQLTLTPTKVSGDGPTALTFHSTVDGTQISEG